MSGLNRDELARDILLKMIESYIYPTTGGGGNILTRTAVAQAEDLIKHLAETDSIITPQFCPFKLGDLVSPNKASGLKQEMCTIIKISHDNKSITLAPYRALEERIICSPHELEQT
jgi:hypothetical protein